MDSGNMVNPTRRDIALFLALGLEYGLVAITDAIAWVDAIIGKDPEPEYWLIDVSTASENDTYYVASLLRKVPGPDSEYLYLYILLSLLRKAWKEGEFSGRRIYKILYDLIDRDLAPAPIASGIYEIDHAYDLALEGFIKMKAAEKEITKFLAPWDQCEEMLPECLRGRLFERKAHAQA